MLIKKSITGSEDSYSHHAVAFKSTKSIPQGTHIVYSTALVMILYENTVANSIPSTKQLEITITPMYSYVHITITTEVMLEVPTSLSSHHSYFYIKSLI